jgi:histidinol dehydrogenase
VGIDSPAGPSELLVIADETAEPMQLATELLAQAEHDPLACVVLIAVGGLSLAAVESALARLLADAPRADVVRQALEGQGALLRAATMDQAISFANEYAAEHLMLVVRDADAVLPRLRNAGTVFVGATASVSFGDYMTGANHVLPTGGLARSYSGLSVSDFFRWTTWQRVDRDAAARLADAVSVLATAEGLPGHAAAAAQWRATS